MQILTEALLAQVSYSYESTASPLASLGAILCSAVVSIGIMAAIAYFIVDVQKRVPPEYRAIEPNMIWLLLIPLFNLVWNFFVFQRVPDSLQRYFDANGGRPSNAGDCGKSMGLWFAILAACSIIPCIGLLTAIAALVLLILFIVKIQGLKKFLPGGMPPSGGFPVNTPPPAAG